MAVESSDVDSDWAGSTFLLISNVRPLCVAEMDNPDSAVIRTPRLAWTSDTSGLPLQSHLDATTVTEPQLQPLLSPPSRTSVDSENTPGELQVNQPVDPPWTSATIDLIQDQLGPVAHPRGPSTAGRTFTPPPPPPPRLPPSQLTAAQISFSAPLITGRPKSSPSLRVVQLQDFDEIQVHSSNPSRTSTDSRGPICRICHEGASSEQLLAPCRCRGTVGLLHRTCIERWLSSSNTEVCEICGFRYTTLRKHRSFCEWLTKTDDMIDLRNIIADLCCFLLLTPLTAVSAWLCLCGALQYSPPASTSGPGRGRNNVYNTKGWESVALIMLSMFLLLVYVIWCIVAINYHARVFADWKRAHQVVRLVLTSQPCAVPRGKTLSYVSTAPDYVQGSPNTAVCVPLSTMRRTFPAPNAAPTAYWETSRVSYLYTKSRVDGRWSFGKLPATSVSDTVMTSLQADLREHINGIGGGEGVSKEVGEAEGSGA